MVESVVLGGGCFWCTEAAYKNLDGVEKGTSGYAGGHTENPSYREVCTGETGHAEVVKVEFNPEKFPTAKSWDSSFVSTTQPLKTDKDPTSEASTDQLFYTKIPSREKPQKNSCGKNRTNTKIGSSPS